MISLLLSAVLATYPPHLCTELNAELEVAVELGIINEQEAELILDNCSKNATLLVNTSSMFSTICTNYDQSIQAYPLRRYSTSSTH